MKLFKTASLVGTLAILPLFASAKTNVVYSNSWKQSISLHNVSVATGSGGTTHVSYVLVNMSDPHVLVQPVVASNEFGKVSSLASLASSNHAVAALNGTYFNAGSNLIPDGTLQIDGVFEHLAGASQLAIGYDGRLKMMRGSQSITVSLHHSWTYPDVAYPWAINEYSGKSNDLAILTGYYGPHTPVNGTSVVVQQGKVTSIHRSTTAIPKNGFVLELANGSANDSILEKIHVGDSLAYRVTVKDASKAAIDYTPYMSTLGAGPLLIDNGKTVLNPRLEGFTDPHILSSQGPKSFVGVDRNENLVLATVQNATISELPSIAQNMHLIEAMAMDSGASTGLYMNGSYVERPGRNLASALVVSYVAKRPVQPSIDVQDVAEQKVVQGQTFVKQKQYANALRCFTDALSKDGENVDALYGMAQVYEASSDWPNTEMWLTKTVQLDPYKYDAWNTLGWVQYDERHYSNAIQTFKTLASLEPSSAVPFYGLGQCYASYSLKQYDLARVNFEKSISLDPLGPIATKAKAALASLPV